MRVQSKIFYFLFFYMVEVSTMKFYKVRIKEIIPQY
jgi:hypothetical protein